MRPRRIYCFAAWLVLCVMAVVGPFQAQAFSSIIHRVRSVRSRNARAPSTRWATKSDSLPERPSEPVPWNYGLPWCLGAGAFSYYQPTAVGFRKLVDHAAHHTWAPADEGKYQAELIIPALNGPVVTSISILFATLSAITISGLYTRQDTLHRTLVAMVEDILELQLLIQIFPSPYQSQARQILGTFADHICELCLTGGLCPRAIRKENLGALVTLVNEMGAAEPQVRDAVLREAYESVDRIHGHRATISATLSATFPVWHYVNLISLALSICTIFLLETDLDVVLFLAGFQLGLCWAMLVGTFSMLAVVCYDLATPFSGIFQIIDTSDLEELEGIRAYCTSELPEYDK